MKNKRQKQQPFYVKRTRMKDSIIKCKEIIQNYTLLEYQLKKNNYEIDFIESEKTDSCIKTKAVTTGHNVQECDLLNNRIGNFDIEQMRNMIKIYQERRYKETQHQMIGNGLTVQKAKKNYVSSRNTKVKTQISPQKSQFVEISPQKDHKPSKNLLKIEVQQGDSRKQMKQSEIQECLVAKSVNKLKPHLLSLKKNESEHNYKQNSKITMGKDGLLLVKTRKRTQTQQSPQQSTKNSRRKQYLYQKMQKLRVDSRMRFNPVYERRIKSYTDFLWKIMVAHNIYVNLDLKDPLPFNARLKAYISYGNNCNMIKGLIKRRFWWNVVEQYSQDCYFVWSQLKSNKIYKRQSAQAQRRTTYIQKDMNQLNQSIIIKRKRMMSKDQRKKQRQQIEYHKKIFNEGDMKLLQNKTIKLETIQVARYLLQSYQVRTKQIHQLAKRIESIQSNDSAHLDSQLFQRSQTINRPLVHNHLQNNFHLGNKKALFYNLRQYYSKINEDVFQYLPLTFHIKNGTKDIEYKKFIKYYNQRKRVITRLNILQTKQKARNIWIVKPGQNSNRGTGIVVIDQIYELDHILKQSIKKKSNLGNKDKDSSHGEGNTFIVQMYIDRPFLYNNRKFDIRHYMLITNLYGVTRAYWYEEGYIRTSSYLFDLDTFDPEIHLTNDAIQKQYQEYGRYEPYNKLSYTELQNYLNTLKERNYNFKSQILPIMKKVATDSVRSVYTQISPSNKLHNFEIFGLDFMIDRDFKPWLIEINTNPCLDCSCPLLDRIIPYMVEQSLKLSLDVVYPPPTHYPNTCKHYAPFISLQTFKYELIFDSLSEGEELAKLYKDNKSIESEIGLIDEDVVFKDDGKQIKLQDFT